MYRNDYDSFLHLAIKHGPTEAAMALIENGANVDFPNAKVSSLSSVKKFAAAFFVCQLYYVCIAIALFRE